MPTALPNEATPVTAGRQGTLSRPGSGAAAGELTGSPLLTADVYQALAYAVALGAERAVLVYPGRRDRCWVYPLTESPIRLEIRTLRIMGHRPALARSLRRLARAVAAKLGTGG